MPHRNAATVFALAVVAALALLAQLSGSDASDARPMVTQVILNPSRDTFLGEGVGSAQDSSEELQTGWVYTTRGREYRAYIEFPLDPSVYPVDGLLAAELWLYPDGPPQTSQIASTFVVRTMSEPFAEGRVAPMWFAADDPTVEVRIDRDVEWKKFDVRAHVRDMLMLPDESCGFEILGQTQTDNTRWDFLSLEGAEPASKGGTQPRLVLWFRDGSLATATPVPSATPHATASPSASPTMTSAPTATPAASQTPTGTATAADSATPTDAGPTAAGTMDRPAYLPRALRRD